MAPEGVDGCFDSVGARKLGHPLAGRLDAAGAKAQFSEGGQTVCQMSAGTGAPKGLHTRIAITR